MIKNENSKLVKAQKEAYFSNNNNNNNNSSWKSSKDIELLIMNTQIKIIDFGMGKDLKETEGFTESVCGSPITMAPEIWINKIKKKTLGNILF